MGLINLASPAETLDQDLRNEGKQTKGDPSAPHKERALHLERTNKTLGGRDISAPLFRRRRLGAADSAPPIRRWTARRRAVLFIYFIFRVMKKKQ